MTFYTREHNGDDPGIKFADTHITPVKWRLTKATRMSYAHLTGKPHHDNAHSLEVKVTSFEENVHLCHRHRRYNGCWVGY